MKKIKGVSFDLLKIDASDFHGYGFRLLTIEWMTKGKMCLIGHSWGLLSLNISKPTDESLRVSVSILGIEWYKYLKPKLVRVCGSCGCDRLHDYCLDTNEYYCENCYEYIHASNTEVEQIYED